MQKDLFLQLWDEIFLFVAFELDFSVEFIHINTSIIAAKYIQLYLFSGIR